MNTGWIEKPAFRICPLQTADREPTSDELEEILEVYRQCEDFLALGPVAVASIPMVLADLELSRKYGAVFCAIRDRASGEMLGIIDIVYAGYEGDPTAAYLSLLMISARHRGRGLGEAVVRAVEEVVRCNPQVQTFFSGVQVNNPGAIRFWQRMGFTIISEPELMPDGTTAMQLERKL